MFKSQKNVFWEALLVTFLIFGIGIIFGIILENSRLGKINSLYQNSEIELLDIRLMHDIYVKGNFNCEKAIQENQKFADRIYNEGKELGRYEQASRLSDQLRLEHKKYDILRTIVFLNSLEIHEKCNTSYHNVLYFYRYKPPRLDVRSKQNVFSRILMELKQKQGDNILLIPIAVDNNVTSVDLVLDQYGIDKNELPMIFIDEKIRINKIQKVEELEKYIE